MNLAILLSAAAVAAGPGGSAPTANFVLVSEADASRATFWDTNSRHPTEDGEIATSVLDVGYSFRLAVGEQPKPELSGALRTYFIDCDWRTIRHAHQSVGIDPNGGERQMKGPPSSGDRRFAAPASVDGRILAEACDGDGEALSAKGEPSAVRAIQRAAALLPPASIPPPLPAPRGPAQGRADEPGRYGVTVRGARGQTALTDWASLVRSDGKAQVRSLWILRESKGPLVRTAMLRELSFDCGAGTIAVRGETFMSPTGLSPVSGPGLEARPVRGPAEKMLLKDACSGAEPPVVHESLDVAIAAIRPSP